MYFSFIQLLDTTRNFLKKDLKVRYAESILGPLWIILYPLALTLISTGVFAFVFQRRIGDTPYFLYVMIGFIPWIFFSQTVSHSTRSLIWNRELITNAKFHKESIVLSIIASKLVDYLINLLIFFFLFFLIGKTITAFQILMMFFILALQITFQIGLGLIFSALNVLYRDIQNIMDIVLQLVFYATPIVYPLEIIPERFKIFFNLNPLLHIVLLYREILLENKLNSLRLVGTLGFVVAVFFLGIIIFKKLEKRFAELI